jgi:hypothetical protein
MAQQINLYLPEFQVKEEKLTPALMGRVLAGFFGFLMLISAYDFFVSMQLNGELEDLQETLVEETRRNADLNQTLALRSENTDLADRLSRAEARLDSSRQIAAFLTSTKLGNVTGFSEFFKDISRASMDGLSISNFTFAEGGESVQIEGQVSSSALVPRYVNNIRRGQSPLANLSFSPVISRGSASQQLFSFELSSNYD